MYRVLNWDRHFEGAKSKTYNNKTSCSLPTKHGLGYRRLVRSKDGTALFGAWCALIQVLSRHPKPRQGYCTDNGRSDGVPYTADDLEMLTDIPAKYFSKMLELCKSHIIGWVVLTESKDTIGDCQGTIVPLNSDLDSNLNSDSNSAISSFECVWKMYERKGNKQSALNYWKKLSEEDREAIKANIPAYLKSQPEAKFRKDFQGWINPNKRHWEDKIIDSQSESTPDRTHVSNSQNPDDYKL